MDGTIINLQLAKGFGFIRTREGDDLFFHKNHLVEYLEFNEQLQERRVRFEIVDGDRGPRAANVRPAER